MRDLQLTDVPAEAARQEKQKVVIRNLCQLRQLQHKFVVMILREASFLVNLQEATLEELSNSMPSSEHLSMEATMSIAI